MCDFAKRFETATKGLEFLSVGSSPGCIVCDYEEEEYYEDEPGFSWQPCSLCNSTLGGDRYTCHYIVDGLLVHDDCCEDCVQYIANGETPTVVD